MADAAERYITLKGKSPAIKFGTRSASVAVSLAGITSCHPIALEMINVFVFGDFEIFNKLQTSDVTFQEVGVN